MPHSAESVAMGTMELFDDDVPPQVPRVIEEKVSLNVSCKISVPRETQTNQVEETREDNHNFIGNVNVLMIARNSRLNFDLPLIEWNALVSLIPESFLVEESGGDIVAAQTEPCFLGGNKNAYG